MEVLGRLILEQFAQEHADVRPAMDAWLCEAEHADWRAPNDIKGRYATASFLTNNRVIFNLKGNKYRLDTKIAYLTGKVIVRRIGTHAEYDGWTFDD